MPNTLTLRGAKGDMLKSVYDTQDEGTVDNSKKLENKSKAQVQDHSPVSHSHSLADITNLIDALAGKAPLSHFHIKTDITDFTYSLLSLEPDSSPYTSGAMESLALFLDAYLSLLHIDCSWLASYSYGFQLSEQREVSNIYCCFYAEGFSTTWFGATFDSVEVFKSNDNSSWTSVEQFDAPPLTQISTFFGFFTLTLTTPQTAQYFKVVNIESNPLVVNGTGFEIKIRSIWYD